MMRYGCILLFVCAINSTAAIFGQNPSNLPFTVFGRPAGGFLNVVRRRGGQQTGGEENTRKQTTSFNDLVQTFTITQPIEHGNASLGKWHQRVQYNPAFYKNKQVIFLMIGGQSPISRSWVSDPSLTYLKWAKQYGAAVFQLEHRCFGQSRPYNNLELTTLRYCTVEQALQDLANFIRQMNVKYKYSKPKWVTFGGSYAGTLNAWFRRKYPHMTVGAVASSAPLTHYLDYFGYSKIMEKVIQDTSASCHNQVGGAMQVILSKTFTAKGRSELSEKLRLAPAFNETTLTVKDIHHLMASIYDLFQSIVQYSYNGRDNITMGGFNTRNLCNILTNTQTNDQIEKIRAVFDWMYAFDLNKPLLPDSTLPNSYQDMIEPLKNTTFDDKNGNERAAWRAWIWISCNQLGLMQTTSSGRNIFGSMLPLNYYIDACVDIFGDTLSITTIRDNNLALRSNYGDATDYTVANIVLPNGSLDPFRLLGTYADYPVIHQKTMLIDGSSHCADMYPEWSGEPPALASARAEIQKELEYFIQSGSPSSITTATTAALLLASLLLSNI